MNILVVISAPYASQRFAGKPLTMIGGYLMRQWVEEVAERWPFCRGDVNLGKR